jgi:hypothetical protein
MREELAISILAQPFSVCPEQALDRRRRIARPRTEDGADLRRLMMGGDLKSRTGGDQAGMTDRRRPTRPSRTPLTAAAPLPPARPAVEAILRAETLARADAAVCAERAALDALARLVDALDRGEGVEHACERARVLLTGRTG